MTVTFAQYETDKAKFFKKHNYEYKVIDGGMKDDVYCKNYVFADDAIWTEVVGPTWEKVFVEVKKVDVEIDVKMLRIEYFNTDEGKSKFYYEEY